MISLSSKKGEVDALWTSGKAGVEERGEEFGCTV